MPIRSSGSGVLCRPDADLGAGRDSELIQDILDMCLGRALRDHEASGDLTIGQSMSDEGRNFALSSSKQLGACGERLGRSGWAHRKHLCGGHRVLHRLLHRHRLTFRIGFSESFRAHRRAERHQIALSMTRNPRAEAAADQLVSRIRRAEQARGPYLIPVRAGHADQARHATKRDPLVANQARIG